MEKQQFELTMFYLMLGADFKKQVEIEYQYLDYKIDKPELRRFGAIQPLKWEHGRKGIHILAWDTEADHWRRFAVENIHRVTLTDKEWTNELKQSIAKAR